jgi:hypothetical protein
MVIYQPFSFLELSKDSCCCLSDHPYHIPLSMCPSVSHPIINVPIHIKSHYQCAHPYHIPLSMCPSISHPIINVPIHITSHYTCAIHITSHYQRADPYHIPLSMCPSISHPTIHVPPKITSKHPDHILPILSFHFQHFRLSVTVVPTLHSPGN